MPSYPASFSSSTFTPDNLIAGEGQLLSRKVTIASGQTIVRGHVLGKISVGAATAAAKSGGNAVNTGALTLDATTPVLAGAQVGVYTARCIAAASNSGTFLVLDPLGRSLGQVAVGATFATQIKFVIADGTQDFIVGEGFDITVAAGSGEYVISLAAATNGSQTPDLIASEATDASGGAKEHIAYFKGDFNEAALTLGTGHTAASIREGLRVKGINLVPTTTFAY